MTIDQMRENLIRSYPGDLWRKKVMLMEDRQVIAIHKKLESKGGLKPRKTRKSVWAKKGYTEPECVQMMMDLED